MRYKMTNRRTGKTLLAMILDTYQEYRNLGYPIDPAVYVIRAVPETLERVMLLLDKGAITKKETAKNWGFQLEADSRLGADEIIFGPELVTIRWSDK